MNTEHELPISYVKQFTPLVVGDVYYNKYLKLELAMDQQEVDAFNSGVDHFNTYFLVSFADRPNTGKQPVGDDVVVDCITDGGDKKDAWQAKDVTWEDYYKESAMAPDLSHHDVNTWKPNHAAMLKQFKSDQGAIQMNYLEQETELATHYSANNNRFYIQEKNAVGYALVLNDAGKWTYSDCTLSSELDSYEFFALDADQDNHKEDAHHIAIQIEKLGNQQQNHIDLAINAGAINDIVISPDEPEEQLKADDDKLKLIEQLKNCFYDNRHDSLISALDKALVGFNISRKKD